jgi:hypothetical protein
MATTLRRRHHPEWSFEEKSEEKSGFFASVVEHFLIHAWMGIATRSGVAEKEALETTFSDARESDSSE